MKRRDIYRWLILLMISTFTMDGFSQYKLKEKTNNTKEPTLILDIEKQVLPLDCLISSALKYSPYLKFDDAMIGKSETDLKLTKRSWHNNLSLFSNYSGGSQQLNFQGGESQNNVLNGYRYGVNLNIPLSEFTSRGLRTKQKLADIEAAGYRRDQTEMELKRQVVGEYNNLIASQKILKIKTESKENFITLFESAEVSFREGNMSLEEYSRLQQMSVGSQADYELALSQYKTLYGQFEELIGVELTKLLRK